MWQVRRVLVVIGSPESSLSRQNSHQWALDTLRDLPSFEQREVVFLDVTPRGQFEFPYEIPEDGRYTGDSFTRCEATELLRTIRLDVACSFLDGQTGYEIFTRLIKDLQISLIRMASQKPVANRPRWNVKQANFSQRSILHRFSQAHPN